MRMSRGAACCLAAAGVAVFSAAAMAKDSTLIVVMGGEAYDGPPKFEVQFDGQTLGQGTVAAAIDTATAGRFADAEDKAPYVQKFTFTVPEKTFRPEGDVRIKFLNEAYGGPGSGRDRNLYIGSVTLNGKGIGASGLDTEAGSDTEPNEMLGAFLVIPDGSRDAVASAPSGDGRAPLATWPAPCLPTGSQKRSRHPPGPIRSRSRRSTAAARHRTSIAISTKSTMSSGSTRIRTS